MRPVQRGGSPQATDFTDYSDAKGFLVSRLGLYCSYCERRVATNLAVEHIQPKGLPAYEPLEGRWDNFLLGCVNCNSTKKDKDLVLADTLLPDRDNTFAAFDYFADGRIELSALVPLVNRAMAANLLSLVGLDNQISEFLDENGKQVALDRVAQRIEVWGIALEAKRDVDANPGCDAVRLGAVRTAQGHGFFSIWMTVFSGDEDMRNRLIDAFPGTKGSGCFDPVTSQPVQPAPNPDKLQDGSKF
ncbi:HNH endonuclease [Limnobacter sp.]|uniref:HNH endonuclease n=1 Tax=Limnobacter sp. TaxID=2003368 RepID=UPI0027BA0F64|nr:HNH endonuclease [Limnobacter sp.]